MLKLATKERRLTIDYRNLDARIPTTKALIANITEMIYNIQRAQGPYFAVLDLANMLLPGPTT